MRELRFVFETIGTRGDVAPLLGLGKELLGRGYDVSLLAPSAFAAEAEATGVAFVPITDQHLDHVGPITFSDFYFPAFQPVVDYFEKALRNKQRLVVVNIDKTATSNLLCERHGLTGVRLHLAPYKLRSLVAPPWPFAARAQGAECEKDLGETLPRYLSAADRDPRLLGYINERRRVLDLPPAISASPEEPHLAAQAGLFPDWYAPPPPDWPSPMPLLGFPLPRPTRELPPELASFLAQGSPPLVFTTGTGVRDVKHFFACARECCQLLGRRAVFLSNALEGTLQCKQIATSGFAELALVLPRAALLVHHGGIGTLARALEAGVPQVISPLKYDQPDNAHRAAALGLGSFLPRDQFSGRSLAALAAHLLGPNWSSARLHLAQRSVRGRDALGACASWLENVTRGRHRSGANAESTAAGSTL
jgi:UDP:flavonoid glycosyltransferase YjiC (YdhE family)